MLGSTSLPASPDARLAFGERKNDRSPRPSPRQNHLLAALPTSDYARLLPHLELIPMPLGWTVSESSGQMRYLYFPTTSIVSLVTDRARLEAQVCECYAVVKREYDRLLPRTLDKRPGPATLGRAIICMRLLTKTLAGSLSLVPQAAEPHDCYRLRRDNRNELRGLSLCWSICLWRPAVDSSLNLARECPTNVLITDTLAWLLRNASKDARGAVTPRAIGAPSPKLLSEALSESSDEPTRLGKALPLLEARTSDLANEARKRTEMLATISHELRNPLAPIVSAVEVLRLSPAKSAAQTAAIEIISRQLHQLTRVLEDLTDASRIATNKFELHKSTINLSEAVKSAVESSLPNIDRRHHRFAQELPLGEIYLNADATRLTQAVANLLNNAARYTPEGGDITLAIKRTGTVVAITVRDTGVGIPAAMLPRIFDMFTQVGEIKGGGLGIGLTLVKEIVVLHGGTIEAVSAGAGQGSEFTMRLPISDVDIGGTVPPHQKLGYGQSIPG